MMTNPKKPKQVGDPPVIQIEIPMFNYDGPYVTAELKRSQEVMRRNVNNLSRWVHQQNEEYLLSVYGGLPKKEKTKLLKALLGLKTKS